jgi:hypothetical protein
VATYLADDLRARIEEADGGHCRYCLTSELNSGIPLTYDHLEPRSKGGTTSFENVCRACRPCNEFKSDATHAVDPLTGQGDRRRAPHEPPGDRHGARSLGRSGLASTGGETVQVAQGAAPRPRADGSLGGP